MRVSLYGAGRYATMITFKPDSDNQTLFRFDRGERGLSWQCAIRDMALVSSADTGLTKTAIEQRYQQHDGQRPTGIDALEVVVNRTQVLVPQQ